MATYGVSYGGARQPRSYGVQGARTLAQSMQPTSSAKPQGFAPLPASSFQPISDTLNSLQVANHNRLAALVAPSTPGLDPSLRNDPASPGTQGYVPNTGTSGTTTAPPAPPAPAGFDETGDPILQQIKAAGQRGVQNAASGALAGAQNDLIGYGSTQVPQSLRDLFAAQSPTSDALLGQLPANSILGALNDPGTATAAAANPFSTLAKLGQGHTQNVNGIDQATNANNLFYSSTHGNQLADENTNYLGSQTQAAQNLAALLSGENTGVLNAEDTAHQQYLNELPNAYQRFIAAGDTGAPAPPPSDGTTPPPGDGTPATAPSWGILPTGAPGQSAPSLESLLAASKQRGGPSASASRLSRYFG